MNDGQAVNFMQICVLTKIISEIGLVLLNFYFQILIVSIPRSRFSFISGIAESFNLLRSWRSKYFLCVTDCGMISLRGLYIEITRNHPELLTSFSIASLLFCRKSSVAIISAPFWLQVRGWCVWLIYNDPGNPLSLTWQRQGYTMYNYIFTNVLLLRDCRLILVVSYTMLWIMTV